jgi:class 3 adenylate cyclase
MAGGEGADAVGRSGHGGIRVGDHDRQAVVDQLREHTAAGRLTMDEFTERVGQAYAAVTRDDLDKVVADLPEGVRPPTAAVGAQPEVGAGRRRRRFVAVMSPSVMRGQWRAPRHITAFAWWGSVVIDLRDASIESPVLDIRAWALMGSVQVIVPPGIPVEMDGVVLMGSSHSVIKRQETLAGAPLVRIHSRGLWGSVMARNPRRRRGHHQIHDYVQGQIEDALDVAQRAIDRALPPGSVADRIPDLGHRSRSHARPDRRDRRDSRRPGASSRSAPSPTPAARGEPQSDAAGPGRIPSGTLTILVSDIAGSTQIAEELGDQAWVRILDAHNAIVRQRFAQHHGTEVKAQGDGFLAVFPSARQAVLAAIAIQRAMADYRRDHPEVPIDLRVGLHTGEVVATDDDVLGQNVVVASRLADAAAPGEIVVSGVTRDLTASASDLGYADGEDVTLKGVSQRWRVHRVLWS